MFLIILNANILGEICAGETSLDNTSRTAISGIPTLLTHLSFKPLLFAFKIVAINLSVVPFNCFLQNAENNHQRKHRKKMPLTDKFNDQTALRPDETPKHHVKMPLQTIDLFVKVPVMLKTLQHILNVHFGT